MAGERRGHDVFRSEKLFRFESTATDFRRFFVRNDGNYAILFHRLTRGPYLETATVVSYRVRSYWSSWKCPVPFGRRLISPTWWEWKTYRAIPYASRSNFSSRTLRWSDESLPSRTLATITKLPSDAIVENFRLNNLRNTRIRTRARPGEATVSFENIRNERTPGGAGCIYAAHVVYTIPYGIQQMTNYRCVRTVVRDSNVS